MSKVICEYSGIEFEAKGEWKNALSLSNGGIGLVNWVSVKDNLPHDHEEYLLFKKEENFCYIGHIDINKNWFDADGCTLEGITHWMPLPNPPKEETNNE